MRGWTVAIGLAWLLSVPPTNQKPPQDGIEGSLRFNPQVADPIDAVVEVLAGSELLDVVTVDPQTPHNFAVRDAAILARATTLRVSCKSPQQYVSYIASFAKVPGQAFRRTILLKRADDIYVEAIALAADQAAVAIPRLDYALNLVESPVQRLEVGRTKAALLASQGDLVGQLDVLSTIADAAGEVGPRKAQVYWTERFDGLLRLGGYGTTKLPERDFASAIRSDTTGDLSTLWRSYVESFATAYPTAGLSVSASTTDEVAKQLRAIMTALGRKDDFR